MRRSTITHTLSCQMPYSKNSSFLTFINSLTIFSTMNLSMVSFMYNPTFQTSLTNLLLIVWSTKYSQQIMGTPAFITYHVEFQPECVKNPHIAECITTSSWGADPIPQCTLCWALSLLPTPPRCCHLHLFLRRNLVSSPIRTYCPLFTKPCQNSKSWSLVNKATLPKLT